MYRELLDRADGDIARAAVELATAPLNDRRAALEAVAAYRALLGAIHAHVKALIIHADRFAWLAASSIGAVVGERAVESWAVRWGGAVGAAAH